MPVPSYTEIMLPLLEYAAAKDQTTVREAIAYLVEKMELNETDLSAFNKNGKTRTFDNRVGWSRTYLKKAGLIDYSGNGEFFITDRGKKVLREKPEKLNSTYLMQFPEFRAFKKPDDITGDTIDPREQFETSFDEMLQDLADQLLAQVKQMDPYAFEKLVVDLLVNMGYGGTHREAMASVTKKSKDGGIDGIINEDRLGLNKIYIQAKRYTDTIIGRPSIAEFAGNLHGLGGLKGVFITTSDFSKDAIDYVKNLPTKIVLINGETLVKYMINYNIGVSVRETFIIKDLDIEYFNN